MSFAKPVSKLSSVLLLAALSGAGACDPAETSSCGAGAKLVQGQCVAGEESQVRLDTVGFLPGRAKRATVSGGSAFEVRRAADDSVVFTGEVPAVATNTDTGEQLAVIDFSAVDDLGRYYVRVDGAGRSVEFEIGNDVFQEPLRTTMLGLFGQRCGVEVAFEFQGDHFSHDACHTGDARTDFVSDTSEIRPVTGGWHDAGDYGKYAVNGFFAVGLLLKAWEHFQPALENLSLDYLPEHGGAIPDFLDESKFQLDWMLKMQFEGGQVSHKVSGLQFEGLAVAPEADGATRYYAPFSTAGTAQFAATAAQASRIFEPYDAEYAATLLAAARRAWAYLVANPETIRADQGSFSDMQYNSNDGDDRTWAAAELWETTGEAEFLTAIEARLQDYDLRNNWDWPDVENLGYFSYALSRHAADAAGDPRNPDVVATLTDKILASAEQMTASASTHAYGRSIASLYYWGINGVVARTVMNLQVAARLTSDETMRARYLDTAIQQVDHLLGRNYYGRSQITGIGFNPPVRPHHRPSVADGHPWPGLVVGGSNVETQQGMAPDPIEAATSWIDSEQDFRTNEVAINWMTAMTYALAGFVQ